MRIQRPTHPTNPDWARDAFARGKVTIAALVHDGVSEAELCAGLRAFQVAGCDVATVGLHGGLIQAYNHGTPGHHYLVAQGIEDVEPSRYDALFVPGGARGLDALKEDRKVVAFIQGFASQQKPIAMCSDAAPLITAAAPDAPVVAADDEGHHAAVQTVRLLIDRAGGPVAQEA